jgi:serine/threonine-protein kinase
MPDLTGQYFSGYKLEEQLRTGEMASIYKAFDKALSRWVTVKLFSTSADLTGEAQAIDLARFWQEAKAFARLQHPNILTIYDYGEEDGWAYLVMEYISRGSLEDRLQPNRPFSWQQTLKLLIPVAQALAFAHEQGVIHRDVKPANILLPAEDWPLLAGFGLAKMHNPAMSNLTAPGQTVGALTYAAPEQIEGSPIDTRVDIYSLGLILHQLLTGCLPFQEETPFERLARRSNEPQISLLQANPTVPARLVSIVEQALAQSPNCRYQSMTELRGELVKVQAEFKERFRRPLFLPLLLQNFSSAPGLL